MNISQSLTGQAHAMRQANSPVVSAPTLHSISIASPPTSPPPYPSTYFNVALTRRRERVELAVSTTSAKLKRANVSIHGRAAYKPTSRNRTLTHRDERVISLAHRTARVQEFERVRRVHVRGRGRALHALVRELPKRGVLFPRHLRRGHCRCRRCELLRSDDRLLHLHRERA